MKCNRCGDYGHLTSVLGKEYYYCRTCKDEIYPETFNDIPSVDPDAPSEVDPYDDFWTQGMAIQTYCQGGPKLNSCDCFICQSRYE